jgi:MFS family permease
MLYPILPIYLTQYLKATGSVVGIIDGIATATQNIVQGISGYLSDKWQKRKPMALFGYILSAVSKPFMGLASNWPLVLTARFSDRLGAGTRAAPRDAMIAASVTEKNKGKAFGLEGIGDNLGAFIGPLLTILLFFSFQLDIHYIFYVAIIPGLLSVLMIALVKDGGGLSRSKSTVDLHLREFPKSYWKYILVTAVFGVGNSSNSFLILQVKEEGFSLIDTVLVYAAFNLVAAIISYPAGSLSDRFGRKPLLLIAFIIFLITYTGFTFSNNVVLTSALFVFYGLFQGVFRAVGKSFAADFVPNPLRANSVGWYSTVVGLSGLLASVIAGLLWDKVSHESVFLYGAVTSVMGIIVLLLFVRPRHFQ